ncbi:MAG: hypothetical protein KGL26_01110 [Pseudomonadota bacterium]|nr:hypothetical protein [Pseudomonadota bacterium]
MTTRADRVPTKAAIKQRQAERHCMLQACLDPIVRYFWRGATPTERESLRFIARQREAVALPSLFDHSFPAVILSLWRSRYGAR